LSIKNIDLGKDMSYTLLGFIFKRRMTKK